MEKPVVLLIRNTYPEFYGGAETYQLLLAKYFSRFSYRPIVVSSSRELLAHAQESVKAPFLRQQNFSGWRNLLLPFYALWQLRLFVFYLRLFRRLRPTVINIESRDDWIAATFAARARGIRIIWTDHMDFRTWVLTNVGHRFKNPIGKCILRCARLADQIVFVSDYERQAFEQITRPRHFTNLCTVKNGSEDEAAKYAKIQPVPDSIAYVGRLVDYKGISELIAAFAIVRRSHPAATLHIYGDGDESIKANLSAPGIIYHGFSSRPLAAIQSHQIFVLPSHREGLSLSLIDAAMLGRAIVATNIDGNPEIVIDHQTGLLVPPSNPEALAKALVQLLSDAKLRQRLGKSARQHYEQHFDFSKTFANELLPLFQHD